MTINLTFFVSIAHKTAAIDYFPVFEVDHEELDLYSKKSCDISITKAILFRHLKSQESIAR